MHHLRGRTDRQFRGVLVIIRDQMAFQLRLCEATMCHPGSTMRDLTIFLPLIKNSRVIML
jgi:hypothetical protein